MTTAGGIRIVPVRRVKPRYPAEAQRQGTQGCVKVIFRLDAQGRPTHLQTFASTPNGVFDQTAVQTMAKWRFRVTDSQGRPATAGSTLIGQVVRFLISGSAPRATSIADWICDQPPPRTLVVEPATAATGLRITKNEDKPVDLVHMPSPHGMPLKSGWADVKFCIDAKGHVADAGVLESSPKGVYDQAALTALRSWSFSGRKSIRGRPTHLSALHYPEFSARESHGRPVKTCGLKYRIPIIGAATLASGPAALDQRPTAIPTRDLALPGGKIPSRGRVTLRFCIDKDGTVDDAKAIKSRPLNLFDHAAMQVLRIWAYWPRTVNGKPVRSCGIQETVVFKLGHSHLVWVYPG